MSTTLVTTTIPPRDALGRDAIAIPPVQQGADRAAVGTTSALRIITSAVPRPAGRATRLVGPPPGQPPVLDVSHVRHPSVRALARRPLPGARQEDVQMPDPTGIACTVARTALEVLRGERAVSQLVRWVSPDVYEVLGRRARLLRAREGAPLARERVQVRRARTLRLGADAAEATVVLVDGERVRAAAARLEVRRGTWRVVALEIG